MLMNLHPTLGVFGALYVCATVSIIIHLSRMFPFTYSLFEKRIRLVTTDLICIILTCYTIINRNVSGLATDSPRGVWGRGWTTCLLCCQGCHGVGRIKIPDFSLTSLSRYIPSGDFLQYIQNNIEITSFINRCFNIVVLKIGQHKGTFSTSWKLSISCAEHYAKHKTQI